MKRPLNSLKAIVICHGKSEKQLAEHFKGKLRLRILTESDKGGEKSIQINGLEKFLNNRKFKTKKEFLDFFQNDIEKLDKDFKIFIIMDTDDCTPQKKEAFINKTMFKGHWAKKYIQPVWNSPNLEEVLVQAGIKFQKRGEKRKGEYVSIFPTDPKYIKNDTLQIEEFRDNLKKCASTNLEVFADFCLNLAGKTRFAP